MSPSVATVVIWPCPATVRTATRAVWSAVIGLANDPAFGPVVMFGLGGIFVEVLRDVSFRLAPIGKAEARRMIDEIRGRAVLDGVRGLIPPPAARSSAVTPAADVAPVMDETPPVESYDSNVTAEADTLDNANAKALIITNFIGSSHI
mgnify:CR=1 FL=1